MGLIHVSRDGGANWANVTPRAYGKFTRTAVDRAVALRCRHGVRGGEPLSAGRLQAVSLEDHGLRRRRGRRSTSGIPTGAYTRSIREDPVRRGLLYAGTETGVYVSFDDGARWEPLQLNLPRASVRDLRVHGNDLIAATHGRAFWAIDDISMLRQIADSVTARSTYLFQPSPAVRWASGGGASLTAGQNPRGGAAIDYFLKATATSTVTLEFRDGAGKVIRSYTSDSVPNDSLKTAADSVAREAREGMRDSVVYEPADSVVAARAGTNRFVWNLRYPGPKRLKNTLLDEGSLDGPVAPPGNYSVRLIVGQGHARPSVRGRLRPAREDDRRRSSRGSSRWRRTSPAGSRTWWMARHASRTFRRSWTSA